MQRTDHWVREEMKFISVILSSRLRCDVNINNITGIRNTDLLRYYAETDDRVAPLGEH